MNPQERVAALEGLLARIQRNAEKPRAQPAPAPAPVQASLPVEFAPVAVAAPPPADNFDQTVDELLEAPIPLIQGAGVRTYGQASEPLSMEPPPPQREAPQSFAPPSEVESEEASFPLVGATPVPIDAPAISGVQPLSTVPQPGAEELGEDDLISVPPDAIKSEPPKSLEELAAATEDVELDFDDEEEVPASSQRARIAPSLEEELAAAPADEHEVPIKTPPPESGPQEAAPPAAALESPRLPDISESYDRVSERPLDLGPTPEQLGDTIELPEPSQARLELDVRAAEIEPEAAEGEASPVSEELEVSLPTRESVGVFDVELVPPATAVEDLRRYEAETAVAAPVPSVTEPTEVVRRPELAGVAAARFLSAAGDFAPKSFVELLDASLRLGGE